jgi:adenosylmethionine-8-amino-7-oxononanoate aminotransferase
MAATPGAEPHPWDAVAALDRAHLIHPITELRRQEQRGPQLFVRGSGVELELAGGRRLLDGFSGLFNISAGHGRTEIADAVAAQMRELAYYPSFWGFGSEPAARLAARVAELLPADRGLRHMLFSSSGSEANEANFRIARLYHAVRGKPEKTKIVSRRWAYHGATRAAGSATGIAAYHALAGSDPGHLHVAPPYCYRCELDLRWPGCALACAGDLEAALAREGPERVAAFVVEPVLGTGGIVVPPPDYFARVAEICARHDVLLIADEVITGFGRTGRWFGMEHWDLRPDLVSLAKGITSGYLPLSASVLSDRVYETIRDGMPEGLPFMFGLTYNNHPACCAAALANLDILEREDLVGNARRVGAHLLERLRRSFGDSPIVGEVRGLGMLAALEIVRDRETREPFPNPADPAWIARRAFDEGLVARALFQCVALAPPLCASEAEVDRMVDVLERIWPEAEARFLAGR